MEFTGALICFFLGIFLGIVRLRIKARPKRYEDNLIKSHMFPLVWRKHEKQ